ncbi:MAG: alpha-glucosidase/alpha-galactosidase [Candidatus Enteromonas sp.]
MFRITFLGAGSTIFAKNILGDCILTPELGEFEIALHDIDPERLEDSYQMLCNINEHHHGKATILKFLDRKESLRGAKYIVNAVQIGGYKPCTVWDFEIPKKYGLTQTIGDTLGVAGIFRALRTIKVMEDFAKDIKEVCPNALFLNYVNPMAMVTGYLSKYLGIRTVGLCHSVQACTKGLLTTLKMEDKLPGSYYQIAGINHQAWLLDVRDAEGNDLYPEIKRRNLEEGDKYDKKWDLVRLEMMKQFGYYITESSEHTSEYTPWFIKSKYPELIERFNIPLDEYPRRCEKQIKDWETMREEVIGDKALEHQKSNEFGSRIIRACETDEPYRFHGNVMNDNGLIANLPREACVEVPCLADKNGITPCSVGKLPEVCAAINRTNINVQILAMKGAYHRDKEMIFHAAALDPHTLSELSLDDIRALVNEMFEVEKDYLPDWN